MITHRDLLKRWPSYEAVREDLAEQGVDLSPFAVRRWAQRQSVPFDYWPFLENAARKRGFTATSNEWLRARKSRVWARKAA